MPHYTNRADEMLPMRFQLKENDVPSEAPMNEIADLPARPSHRWFVTPFPLPPSLSCVLPTAVVLMTIPSATPKGPQASSSSLRNASRLGELAVSRAITLGVSSNGLLAGGTLSRRQGRTLTPSSSVHLCVLRPALHRLQVRRRASPRWPVVAESSARRTLQYTRRV
ncbi:hypothetical protein MRX96_046682 [Rhipicephalus microplus]